MTTYKISPKSSCKYCHGSGEFGQASEAWGATVTEYLICDCVIAQLPDDFNDDIELDIPYFADDSYEEDEDFLLACFDTD